MFPKGELLHNKYCVVISELHVLSDKQREYYQPNKTPAIINQSLREKRTSTRPGKLDSGAVNRNQ